MSAHNFLEEDFGLGKPDETGNTACNAHLQLALDTIPNYSDLYVPLPSGYFKLDLGSGFPIRCYDDHDHNNKKGIRIVGEGGPAHNGGKYHFRCTGQRKQGIGAKITAGTSVEPRDYHQTVELDGHSGVLQVDAELRWRGRYLVLYNCADDANNCEAIILDVPADNTVLISNENVGALSTDLNNGSICWWIDEPVMDIRCRDFTLENLGFGLVVSKSLSGEFRPDYRVF